jgi:hypothetical protein
VVPEELVEQNLLRVRDTAAYFASRKKRAASSGGVGLM